MWSESPFPAATRHHRAPSAAAQPLSKLGLSVRLVMKMSVILCNVMQGTVCGCDKSDLAEMYTLYSTQAFYNVVPPACT